MSCGYNSSSNEWDFSTVRLKGALFSNQLNIQSQKMGPVLHIKSDRKSNQDLIRVDNLEKNPIFQITHDGQIVINGVANTNVMKKDNVVAGISKKTKKKKTSDRTADDSQDSSSSSSSEADSSFEDSTDLNQMDQESNDSSDHLGQLNDDNHNINLPYPTNCIKIDYEPVLCRNRLHLNIAETNDGIMMTNNNAKKKTSWKIGMNDNGDLLFQRLIDGKWVTRHCID